MPGTLVAVAATTTTTKEMEMETEMVTVLVMVIVATSLPWPSSANSAMQITLSATRTTHHTQWKIVEQKKMSNKKVKLLSSSYRI